ncbi:MAG: HPr(Ser) kinase/phosphatase [Verrucomicrobia bacterium]|nr:HPr(Ser) kinase/phosphatase [Verrucomicrobiota bacterium]MBV9673460.1 HPr(Ser) kinase/phosphatase [Verrucomicrobiota bacterium]
MKKGKLPFIEVGEFYHRHGDALQMKLTGPPLGYNRKIREPTINRPGLALSGFFTYFAEKRIQVLGNAEVTYLRNLPESEQRERCLQLCQQHIPCIIVSRSLSIPQALTEAASKLAVAIFRTPLVTMRFINAATIALEMDFAPTATEHGSMVDIMGIGALVRGSSGIGKSECVLGLIERGYSLVSDDVTRFRLVDGRELVGTAPDLTRYHMEVRGLGIINIASIFGVGSIRMEKRLDLIVTLRDWQELEEVDRIGLEQEFYEILGIHIPHITIPVRTGRDLGRLVEVAALDQKLKSLGQNSAVEFNEKLLKLMQTNKEN